MHISHFPSPADDVATSAKPSRFPTPAEISDLRKHLAPAIAEADRHDFTPFTAEDIIQERRAARAARPTPRHHEPTTRIL